LPSRKKRKKREKSGKEDAGMVKGDTIILLYILLYKRVLNRLVYRCEEKM